MVLGFSKRGGVAKEGSCVVVILVVNMIISWVGAVIVL